MLTAGGLLFWFYVHENDRHNIRTRPLGPPREFGLDDLEYAKEEKHCGNSLIYIIGAEPIRAISSLTAAIKAETWLINNGYHYNPEFGWEYKQEEKTRFANLDIP